MKNSQNNVHYISSIDYIGPYFISSTGETSNNYTIILSRNQNGNLNSVNGTTSVEEETDIQPKMPI